MAFNRDELRDRPTLVFGAFEDDVNIFAGKDLISGGTCVGFNRVTGVVIILTNYDLPLGVVRQGNSRGKLTRYLLRTDLINPNTPSYPQAVDSQLTHELNLILTKSNQYSPFNLIALNLRTKHAQYICSELPQHGIQLLTTGKTWGLCNGYLLDIWPKTQHGLHLFNTVLQKHSIGASKQ